jgi:hypothetical protein
MEVCKKSGQPKPQILLKGAIKCISRRMEAEREVQQSNVCEVEKWLSYGPLSLLYVSVAACTN